MIAERWIESSNRMTSGSTSNASDTGSTVGSSTAKTSISARPMRRFRRSLSALRIRRRTSARMKIGISKASPLARSVTVTNEK